MCSKCTDPNTVELLERRSSIVLVVFMPPSFESAVFCCHDHVDGRQCRPQLICQRGSGIPNLAEERTNVSASELDPEHSHRTTGRVEAKGRDPSCCRLSRSVRAEHDPVFAAPDRPVESPEDLAAIDRTRDVGELEHDIVGQFFWRHCPTLASEASARYSAFLQSHCWS